MSRGPNLLVTMSAVKRTFATQKARALWALGGSVNLMAGYDIWSGDIRLWWSRTKRERPRCGARCRDGSPCEAPPVWDRPLDGRCRMHGGLSTGPRTEEGRRRIAESNRARRRDTHHEEKRGKREAVTQHGDAL
jgi:hypothetical protein